MKPVRKVIRREEIQFFLRSGHRFFQGPPAESKLLTAKKIRPLLEIDLTSLDPKAHQALKGDRRHLSWIKSHGKGRVFYCSPSHLPETYEHQNMLQYYLDGVPDVPEDLECNDSPTGK